MTPKCGGSLAGKYFDGQGKYLDYAARFRGMFEWCDEETNFGLGPQDGKLGSRWKR